MIRAPAYPPPYSHAMLDLASLLRICATVIRLGVPVIMLLLYLAAIRDGTIRDRERPFDARLAS